MKSLFYTFIYTSFLRWLSIINVCVYHSFLAEIKYCFQYPFLAQKCKVSDIKMFEI